MKIILLIQYFLILCFSLPWLHSDENCIWEGILKEGKPPLFTLDVCRRIALDQNPSTRAATEGYYAAMASVGIAEAPYYPDLNFEAYYSRFKDHFFFPAIPIAVTIPSTIGPFNDYLAVLTSRWILYDFGERRANLSAAVENEGVAKEEIDRINQQVLLDVTQAFYRLTSAKELLEVAKNTVKRSEDHAKIARQRKKAGDVASIDVYRSEVVLAQDKQALIRAKNRARKALTDLKLAMGLPPGFHMDIASEKADIRAPEKMNLDLATDLAIKQRPEIAQQMHRLEALYQEINKAYSAYGPKLVASGIYGKHDDRFFPRDPKWVVQIDLQVPIFHGFKDQNNVKRAEAEYLRGMAEYERLVLLVQKEVWDAWSDIEEAYEAIQTAETQAADAKESSRLASERYNVGSGTLTDMLDTDNSLYRAQAEQIQAKWSYQSAYAKFLWTVGNPLVHVDCSIQ